MAPYNEHPHPIPVLGVPLAAGVSLNHPGNGISDHSHISSSTRVEPFQVHDIHGDNEMTTNLDEDDDPAFVAIKEQLEGMDEWFDKVIQPILQPESERQQQQDQQQQEHGGEDKTHEYDDYDSDDDGIQEECFALHYYSERKLRHDLHRVDLILRPALSLSRPSGEMPYLDDNWHALGSTTSSSSFLDDVLEGRWRESFPQSMQPQHRLAPVSPTPIRSSIKSPNNNWYERDEQLLHGSVVPSSQPTVSNLSFDSSTVTIPKATTISLSSSSSTRSTGPHDTPHDTGTNPCRDTIVSSPWSSHDSLPDDHLLNPTHASSYYGPPSLTMVDSNSSILSAITRETSTSDSKSCPWSGIVTPSPPSHHWQPVATRSSPLALLNPSSSSSSVSSISDHKSKRNIFLESLHIHLRDIDSLLQADSSNSSSFPAQDEDDDDDVTPDEILDDLESNWEIYRDLDTIKTQLLHAKAATIATGHDKAGHFRSVNALEAMSVKNQHDQQHITPPNIPSPPPPLSQPPTLSNQHQGKDFLHKFNSPANVDPGKVGKDASGTSFASPITLYPEDGETEPTTLSSLSLESNQAPNYPEGGWHDDMARGKTFQQGTSAVNISPINGHDNLSAAKWNEIGNLISSNIQESVKNKERTRFERRTRTTAAFAATTTATTKQDPLVDPPDSYHANTKEDHDPILHALARIYARMYLKAAQAQQDDLQQDNLHDHPLRESEKHETGVEENLSSCHPTLRPDNMIDDRDIEDAIYRISLRVQLGALRLVEERRQLSASERTWQKQMQDHMTQHRETIEK